MRFARLQCDGEEAPLGIEDLVDAGQFDWLQLDYPRPRSANAGQRGAAELPEYAIGFSEALRASMKALYLDPQLHLIASAGWGDAFSCVERAAETLVAGGCGDLPLAAVRGSNLLPILQMVEADGVDLAHAETGAPWRELRKPILAADLQLGAGPLTMALAEQARIVVAGAFDGTAPLIAAAVHQHHWNWNDADLLATAVAAARAATWIDWQAFPTEGPVDAAWRPPLIELNASGQVLVEPLLADASAASRLQQWLRTADSPVTDELHADLRARRSELACTPYGPGQLIVAGSHGAPSDDCWQLEVLYEAGFAAEALIEFSAASDPRWRSHLATLARTSLQSQRDGDSLLSVEELRGGAGGWLHLAFQSTARQECQRFVDQLVKLSAAHRPHARLTARPDVHVHCGRWPARVPRSAIDIAVETRIAREWV